MMSVERTYSEITFDTKEEMSLDLDYSDNARAGLLEKNRSTSKLLLGIDKIKRKASIRQKKKVISLDAYKHLQWELVAANQTIVVKESEITFLNFQVSARESASSILTSKIDTLEQTIKAKEKEIQALRSKKEADDTKRLKKSQFQASSIAANGIDGANKPKSDSRNSLKNEENYSKGLVNGGSSKSLRRASSHSPGTLRKKKSPKTSRKTLQNGELVQIPNLEKEESLRKLKRKEESSKRLNNKDKIAPPASPGALKKKSPKTSRIAVHLLDIPAPPASPGALKHKKKAPKTSRKTMHNDELVHQLDIAGMEKQEKWRKQKIKDESTKNLTVRDKSIVPPSPRPPKEKKSPRVGRKALAVDPEGHTCLFVPLDERELIARNLQKEISSTRLDASPGALKHKMKSPKTSRKTMHNDEFVHQLDIPDMEKQEKWRKQKIKDESTKNLTVRDKSIVPPSPRPLKEKKSPRVGRKSLAVDPEGYTGLTVPLDERELIARNLQKEESSTRLDANDNSAILRFLSLVDLGDDAPESRSPLRKKRSPRVSSRKTLTVVEHNGMAQLVMPSIPQIDQKPMVVEDELVGDLKPNHEYKTTSRSRKSRIRSLSPGFLKGSSSRKSKSRSSSPGLHKKTSTSRTFRSISLFKNRKSPRTNQTMMTGTDASHFELLLPDRTSEVSELDGERLTDETKFTTNADKNSSNENQEAYASKGSTQDVKLSEEERLKSVGPVEEAVSKRRPQPDLEKTDGVNYVDSVTLRNGKPPKLAQKDRLQSCGSNEATEAKSTILPPSDIKPNPGKDEALWWQLDKAKLKNAKTPGWHGPKTQQKQKDAVPSATKRGLSREENLSKGFLRGEFQKRTRKLIFINTLFKKAGLSALVATHIADRRSFSESNSNVVGDFWDEDDEDDDDILDKNKDPVEALIVRRKLSLPTRSSFLRPTIERPKKTLSLGEGETLHRVKCIPYYPDDSKSECFYTHKEIKLFGFEKVRMD
jgi:hypothetical protein